MDSLVSTFAQQFIVESKGIACREYSMDIPPEEVPIKGAHNVYSITNENNTVANQGNTVINVPDNSLRRLEDIGRIRSILEELLNHPLFEENAEKSELFEQIKEIKGKIMDCWTIASGKE